MPVQQITVKNSSEIENFDWTMAPFPQSICGEGVRMGSSSSQTSYSNSSGDICRICHCESDAHNPLLAPCYCSGSLKYVHQSCLQQWLTASATRSCELCKFHFIMHTKIKPFNEWRLLEMSGVERRRLCCAVLFHCVAALCVMWSLFVLIERAVEEVNRGMIAWPFWTKLVVVAVGFTGGAVFMYIQCRQYLQLCNRWRAHNRILLIQNAPEKISLPPPSPVLHHMPVAALRAPLRERDSASQGQVVANIENNPHLPLDQPVAANFANLGQYPVEQHPLPDDNVSSRTLPPRKSWSTYTEEDESGGFETYTYNPYRRVSSINEKKMYSRKAPDASSEVRRTEASEARRYSDTKLLDGARLPRSRPNIVQSRTCPSGDIARCKASAGIVDCPASTSCNYFPEKKLYLISKKVDPAPTLSRRGEIQPDVSDLTFEVGFRDPLEINIREMLELDAQSVQFQNKSAVSLNRERSAPGAESLREGPRSTFKSLPNLSASSENLLPQKSYS